LTKQIIILTILTKYQLLLSPLSQYRYQPETSNNALTHFN